MKKKSTQKQTTAQLYNMPMQWFVWLHVFLYHAHQTKVWTPPPRRSFWLGHTSKSTLIASNDEPRPAKLYLQAVCTSERAHETRGARNVRVSTETIQHNNRGTILGTYVLHTRLRHHTTTTITAFCMMRPTCAGASAKSRFVSIIRRAVFCLHGT